jgi:O-antigen ligase
MRPSGVDLESVSAPFTAAFTRGSELALKVELDRDASEVATSRTDTSVGSMPSAPSRPPSYAGKLSKAAAVIGLLGFPASLTSPGATISMALVGLYGLALAVRDGLPDDLRRVHRYMLACYLLVLVVDLLNGSVVESFFSTGINYLPLLALAPYAYALRRLSLTETMYDRALQVTMLLAVAISCFRLFVLGEPRPDGINLNSIPYSFVVAMWGVFLLARGLQRPAGAWPSLIAAAAGLIPLLIGESKTAMTCMIVGYAIVYVLWAAETRRWLALAIGSLVGVTTAVSLFFMVAWVRIGDFAQQLESFLADGTLNRGTFGQRYELITSGLRAFVEKPFLGYGLNQRMNAVFDHLEHPDIGAQTSGHLHNDYITHMVSFGVFGLLFLVAYFVLTYRLIARSGDTANQRASVALLAMLMIYMVTEVAFNMDPISGAVTLALGMTLARPASAPSAIDGKSTKSG